MEGDQWANQMEYNLSLGDWITNVSYFCLVSICAPVWEEVGEGLRRFQFAHLFGNR